MQIEFIGAAREVTGSCHFVSFGQHRILVDCGMEQGADIYENQEIPVNPAQIDCVFVTHAHIDHSGLLPLLYKNGFRGKICTTQATANLCYIMLMDSAHIQESEAEWKSRKAERAGGEKVLPMYDTNDARGALDLFVPCSYHEELQIFDDLKVRFVDAGHLLGSASIEMWITEDGVTRKIVFSGDLGNGVRPLIRDPEPISDADYVLVESTYGDRNHDQPVDYALALADVLRDTFRRGGNLVIPAFSVGRTQEMLYHLRRIQTEKLLPEYPDFPVYIDSPLGVEATNIYNKSVADCFNDEAQKLVQSGINPIQFPGLHVAVALEESKAINSDKTPKVIISASGMCEAGRIRHHLKHNLWRADSTVLFVGYQVPGTMGHNLLDGVKKVKLFGEEIEVNAKIVKLPGISGHADHDHLTAWMAHFDPKKTRVFVVHGEDQVAAGFADHLHTDLGFHATAPYTGDCYDLITGEQTAFSEKKRAEKKAKQQTAKRNTVFDRLVAAGQRLLVVIQHNKGGANKDLAKFADQIDTLCSKWDR